MSTKKVKRIIIDCDNTVGINGRPMDDALAILYLLGKSPEAEVVAICTSYGNGTSEECYQATVSFMEEIGAHDIPVYHGSDISASTIRRRTGFNVPDNGIWQDTSREASPAARFIVEAVNESPDELIYLCLGSTVNLYEAAKLDPSVYDKIKQCVLMGGITEDLFIHNTRLHELNFSINAEASYDVLRKAHNVTIITGNNCLPVAALSKEDFWNNLCISDNPTGIYIAKKCGYRFKDKELEYSADSSYCWDGVAAAYIMQPDLFDNHPTSCRISAEGMAEGYLNPVDPEDANCVLNLPTVKDKRVLQHAFYESWLNLRIDALDTNYSFTGLYLDKLIQPCILVELSKMDCHGFLLLQTLKAQGHVDENLDPSGFYRNLKHLEEDGYLTSYTTIEGSRNKKVYAITDFGRKSLVNWQDSLVEYSEYINNLIERIESVK